MEKTAWREIAHHLLRAAGFAALVVVVSGAHGRPANFEFDFLRRPSPLILPACELKRAQKQGPLNIQDCVTLTRFEENKNLKYEKESKPKEVRNENVNTGLDIKKSRF